MEGERAVRPLRMLSIHWVVKDEARAEKNKSIGGPTTSGIHHPSLSLFRLGENVWRDLFHSNPSSQQQSEESDISNILGSGMRPSCAPTSVRTMMLPASLSIEVSDCP